MNKSKTSQTGSIGEDVACRFLERKGFIILARNYRKPWGEIDIIAEKGGVVRFVEVKALSVSGDISRENIAHDPEEQIHPMKLKKIVRTAELYMASSKDEREFQIDAVGVFLDQAKRVAKCRLSEQIL
jgi:putative endonuclease